MNTNIIKNEQLNIGAIIGGCFTLVPFFWGMKYNPTHEYELVPSKIILDTKSNTPALSKSKIDRLREIKQLLDEKIITQEEYEKEKKKILAME